MYKAIIKLIIALISQPAKTWKILAAENDKNVKEGEQPVYEAFLGNYFYPLLGTLTVAAFLSICTRQEFDIEQALKSSIVALVSAFGGFYIASYLLNEFRHGVFKVAKDLHLCQMFVGYASSLMFTLNIIWLLLPDFFFLYIFILYTFYIVWEGTLTYMKLDETGRMKFTIITSLLVIGTPKLIEFLLVLLMPGLR